MNKNEHDKVKKDLLILEKVSREGKEKFSDPKNPNEKIESKKLIELTPIEEANDKNERKKKKKHHKKKKKEGDKNEKDDDSDEEDEAEKKEKKDKKTTQDTIAGHFVLLTEIGKGAFGQIFLSYSIRDNVEVAIKKEIKKPQKSPQLKTEAKVYQALLGIPPTVTDLSGASQITQEEAQGIPKFYGVGELVDCHYLIMEFLGPNLVELFNYCNTRKFTVSTVCLIAIQVLNRIENMHKNHFIHRDIKPENFLIGTEDKSNVIYMIDFGLSKRYKNVKNHQHIPYREGRLLTGTARYVSINTHLGIEQSRRDDLESIGYVIVFFLKGSLPWQGLKTGNDKYTRIMEKKLQIPTEILCYGLPDEIAHYLNYCKSLRFEDRPDYDYLRGLFIKLLGTCSSLYGLTKEYLRFDWCFDDPLQIWAIYNRKKVNKKKDEEPAKDPNSSPRNKETPQGPKNWNICQGKAKESLAKMGTGAMRSMASKIYLISFLEIEENSPCNDEDHKDCDRINEDLLQKTNENNPHFMDDSDEDDSSGDNLSHRNNLNYSNNQKAQIETNSNKSEKSEDTIKLEFNSKIHSDYLKNKLTDKDLDEIFNNFGVEDIDKYITKLIQGNKLKKQIKIDPSNVISRVYDAEKALIMNNEKQGNINGTLVQNSRITDKLKVCNEIIRSHRSQKSNRETKEIKKEVSPESCSTVEMKNDKTANYGSILKNITKDLSENSQSDDSSDVFGKKKIQKKNVNNKPAEILEEKVSKTDSKIQNLQDNLPAEISFKSQKRISENEAVPKNVPPIGQKHISNSALNFLQHISPKPDSTVQEVSQQNQVIPQNIKPKGEKKVILTESYLFDLGLNTNKQSATSFNKPKISSSKVSFKEQIEDPNVIITSQKSQEYDIKVKEETGSPKNKVIQNKISQKSFEFDIIKKISSPDIQQRRKSKILDINVNPVNMKLCKDTLIKISAEPIVKYYVIIGELGHGSYGQVKKVRHRQLGEERAMKIVNKKSESSHNEIEILRKISHPNILSIHEIFEDSKKYYIMSELLEGGELFEVITSQGSFSEADAAKILKQILNAVNYLHNKQIVHRDLKPENIMLVGKSFNAKYEIKIIDFGTAKQMEPGQKLQKFIGTSYYIAPEVIAENYDEKCDVWSCGVIFYILLCGYPPFNGSSNVDIYHAIKSASPTFPGDEWKDISKDAIDLIKSMLNKTPSKRPSAEMCLNNRWFKLFDEEDAESPSPKLKVKTIQKKVINKMAEFVKENKLKQAVLQFITTQFNLKDEEESLRALFKQFDTEKKGQISNLAFNQLLSKHYGENDAKDLTEKIFSSLDLDGSGEISYNEFLTSIIDSKKIVTHDRLEKAFKMFDKDGNGKISIDEIRTVFGGDEDKWKKIIQEIDTNQDGEIDFMEFKTMMKGFDRKTLQNY